MSARALPALVFVFALFACARRDAVVPSACGPDCGGCCDASGQCVEGNTAQACGLDGIACLQCEAGCFDGQCVGGTGGGGAGGGGGSAGGAGGGGEEADAGVDLCPPDGWCSESPADDGTRLTPRHLRGVFAVSALDVWAVGDQGTALHYDGKAWASRPPPAADDLFAVFGFGPNDVWACGGSGWPTGPVGVVFHWDGARWSESLRGTQRLEALWGAAPNDLWAVGTGGEQRHWDGAQWTAAPKVTAEAITALHGVAPNKVWAAGSSGLVMAYDGSAWSVVPNSESSGFAAVWAFSPVQVWVMGGNGVAQVFDGTNWKPVNLGAANTILGFWGQSPAEAWGVGPDTLLRFSAASPSRKQAPTQDLLLDVHGADPHHVWAVGFRGTILRYRR